MFPCLLSRGKIPYQDLYTTVTRICLSLKKPLMLLLLWLDHLLVWLPCMLAFLLTTYALDMNPRVPTLSLLLLFWPFSEVIQYNTLKRIINPSQRHTKPLTWHINCYLKTQNTLLPSCVHHLQNAFVLNGRTLCDPRLIVVYWFNVYLSTL